MASQSNPVVGSVTLPSYARAAATLDESTPLITSGILDSIGTVRLVSFLEEQFGVQLDAHEIGVDHLNTLTQIAQLVLSKRG